MNPSSDLMDIEDEESTPVTTPDNESATVNPIGEHPTFINQPNSVSIYLLLLLFISICVLSIKKRDERTDIPTYIYYLHLYIVC